jgi:hypothetical protein
MPPATAKATIATVILCRIERLARREFIQTFSDRLSAPRWFSCNNVSCSKDRLGHGNTAYVALNRPEPSESKEEES